MSVKRYEPDATADGYGHYDIRFDERPDGQYVTYADYEVLAEQYQTYRECASASIGAELGQAAEKITRLERERDGLRVKVEAARKILEPMADCDPDIREWLGLPRFGEALRSPEDI